MRGPGLVIDANGFGPEDRDSKLMVDGSRLGWKSFIACNLVGQRFHGVGLGPDIVGVRAQDQLGQSMKAGKLVIHGDVGQTFMYGAKGGEVYIRGNADGNPLADADWALIKPYLLENEQLFGIKLDDLLTHHGKKLQPAGLVEPPRRGRKASEPRLSLDQATLLA